MESFLKVAAVVSLVAMLGPFVVLLFLPKKLIANSESSANSLRKMGLPPWAYLNRIGKGAYVTLYVFGATLLTSLIVGAVIEQGVK